MVMVMSTIRTNFAFVARLESQLMQLSVLL